MKTKINLLIIKRSIIKSIIQKALDSTPASNK